MGSIPDIAGAGARGKSCGCAHGVLFARCSHPPRHKPDPLGLWRPSGVPRVSRGVLSLTLHVAHISSCGATAAALIFIRHRVARFTSSLLLCVFSRMPLAPFCRPVEQLFAEINASLVWLMEATPAEVRDPLPAGVWDKSFQMQLPPPSSDDLTLALTPVLACCTPSPHSVTVNFFSCQSTTYLCRSCAGKPRGPA